MTEPNSEPASVKESPKSSTDSLPTAAVVQRGGLTESKFWILTLLALLVALGLAWWSMPAPGTDIKIHFPEGHGLHEGDSVRYRGIEVGEVRSIELAAGMEAIDVHVRLKPSASRIARVGTEFWIVRPTLGIGGVSGLDTAVGPKYIALAMNGDNESSGKRMYEFQGLADAPQHGDNDSGIEIVLRADKRHSVSAGSGVSYRGMEVGRILDIGLSDDARYVDLRARIYSPFNKLVTSETKFWANSGVDIDFSFRSGLSLDSESLETIARGGVSFLTIKAGGRLASPGQIFSLAASPETDWLEKADSVRLPTVELKGAASIVVKSERSGLLGKRTVESSSSGIPVQTLSGDYGILVPASVAELFQDDDRKIKSLRIDANQIDVSDASFPEQGSTANEESAMAAKLEFLPLSSSIELDWQRLADAFPDQPVEGKLIAVRRSVSGQNSSFMHTSIDPDTLTQNPDGTTVINSFKGDRDLWNGSPVLSEASGEIVGMLIVSKKSAEIISNDEIVGLQYDGRLRPSNEK